jgi:ATP-dependent 26S proteasome regulatory subunit
MEEDGSNSAASSGGGAENVQQQQAQSEREQVLEQYRAKIREHREVEARLKRMREDVKGLHARYQKTEDDLSALQSVGQIIGDVLKRLDAERFIVKASSGPRYVVGCRSRLNHNNLKPGTRVALDMTTLTIMRILPREVDPTVFHMQAGEEDGGVSFADIGGLNEQIRELREVIELPLTNPELFVRVGIKVGLNPAAQGNLNVRLTLAGSLASIGSQRSPSLWAAWDWKDPVGASPGLQHQRDVSQSGRLCNCRQIHWRISTYY